MERRLTRTRDVIRFADAWAELSPSAQEQVREVVDHGEKAVATKDVIVAAQMQLEPFGSIDGENASGGPFSQLVDALETWLENHDPSTR